MRFLVASALVSVLAFAGTVHAAERIVVAFGDSLTAGLGVMPAFRRKARPDHTVALLDS